VIDPLDGRRDIEERLIRPVSPSIIADDPLRALRAVRQASELDFHLAEETDLLIRQDGHALCEVAAERVRDEVARLLSMPAASTSLELLDGLGLLTILFPELRPMRALSQPPPHHLDAFDHALSTVRGLEQLLGALPVRNPAADGMGLGVAPRPGFPTAIPNLAPLLPFAAWVQDHLGVDMGGGRPRLVALKMAALLHDTGKPGTRSLDHDGRIRFFGHEQASAEIASTTMRRLRFTNSEVRLVRTVVRHHMRPILLAKQGGVTARAVYRFFRDTGDAGIDTLLHAPADHLATYPPGKLDSPSKLDMPGELGGEWIKLVDLVARMLGDYWEGREERVEPPRLLDGRDIMRELDLRPGPQIGQLLETVREAQVSGEVRTREEALGLLRRSVAS
jgi:tRNA nucleotidyltransferase/poly(A) polymerase